MTNEVTTEIEESTAADDSIVVETAATDTPEAETTEVATDTPEAETTEVATEEPVAETVAVETSAPEAPEEVITPAAEPAVEATIDDSQAPNAIDFGAILEQFEQEQITFHPGELVEGKVVGTSDRGILVDFGYKSEGVVPVEEFTGEDGQLTVKSATPSRSCSAACTRAMARLCFRGLTPWAVRFGMTSKRLLTMN